jgi:hypothetical protein
MIASGEKQGKNQVKVSVNLNDAKKGFARSPLTPPSPPIPGKRGRVKGQWILIFMHR